MKAGSWNKLITLVEVNTRIYCAKPVAGDHYILDRCGPNWAVQGCCGFITPRDTDAVLPRATQLQSRHEVV